MQASRAIYPDMAIRMPSARLEIAAAGGYCVLLTAPPGTGKSMLARRFAGVVPEMTAEQARSNGAAIPH